ncbi:MAG: hypothetical protein LAO03_13950 [Acidobacteriia bacterium]|nr:hypothetical protein [Terriglobia bacterium]
MALVRAEATRVAAMRVEASRVEATRVEASRVDATRVAAMRVEARRVAAMRVEATLVTPGFSLTFGIVDVAFFDVLLLIKDFFWIAISIPPSRRFFGFRCHPNSSLLYRARRMPKPLAPLEEPFLMPNQ